MGWIQGIQFLRVRLNLACREAAQNHCQKIYQCVSCRAEFTPDYPKQETDVRSNPKQVSAEHAITFVKDGMLVGLGTGSTASLVVRKLGELQLAIRGIPSSEATRALAEEVGIQLTDFSEGTKIDLAIDGADEVDSGFNMTKGGGGALLREKIILSASQLKVIVVDEGKLKTELGDFPLPVEVVPFGWQLVRDRLEPRGQVSIRMDGEGSFITDGGHYILDCEFGRIEDPPGLEREILCIPGVVECGLFVGLADRVVIGHDDGTVETRSRSQEP